MKKRKVYISSTKQFPIYLLDIDLEESFSIIISEDLYNEYLETMEKFFTLQEKLKELKDGCRSTS